MVVDAKVAGIAVVCHGADESVGLSDGIVVKFDKAGGGVCASKGGEVAEEGGAGVVVGKDIACYGGAEEDCSGEQSAEGRSVHVALIYYGRWYLMYLLEC